MDIKLKKTPWYIRYRYHLVGGIAFLSLCCYLIYLLIQTGTASVDTDDLQIAEVKNEPFLEYVDIEGIVQPIQTIEVNSLESGYVEKVVAEEGAMLHQGDTILVLSNPELNHAIEDEQDAWANNQRNYREQEIEMNQKSITLRQQALDAKHQMASIQTKLKQSRDEYKMGVKSKAELEVEEEDFRYQKEKARLQMLSLRHDSVATRLKREIISANRQEADKKLLRTKMRTQQLVVRAPVTGQLSYIGVTQGQQVSAGNSIGQIKVLHHFKIQVSLSEYYIDRITVGLPANIQYGGKKYALRLSRVIPEVKDHNFVCELTFVNQSPANVRLGKSYRVLLELGKPERALTIPRGDFYQATNGDWIFKLTADGKTAKRVPISIGRQNPLQYEVTSGLKAGDKILVSGYDKIGEFNEVSLK